MTTLEIIKKEINKLSSGQLKKVKGYIDNMAKTGRKMNNKRKRVRPKPAAYDEYYGLYNYSKDKIDKDLKKMREDRSRKIEIPD